MIYEVDCIYYKDCGDCHLKNKILWFTNCLEYNKRTYGICNNRKSKKKIIFTKRKKNGKIK
jgi:hypothetical protein